MAKMDTSTGDGNSLYPIAVLIDELRNDDVQVWTPLDVFLGKGRGPCKTRPGCGGLCVYRCAARPHSLCWGPLLRA